MVTRRLQPLSTARDCAYPVIDFRPVGCGFGGFTEIDCEPVLVMFTRGPPRATQVRHREIAFHTIGRKDRGARAIPREYRARELSPLRGQQSSPRGEWWRGGGRLRRRCGRSLNY